MDTTPSTGPPLLGEQVSPHERQWQAECVLAEALSSFQADLKPATDFTLAAVVTAAQAANRPTVFLQVMVPGRAPQYVTVRMR